MLIESIGLGPTYNVCWSCLYICSQSETFCLNLSRWFLYFTMRVSDILDFESSNRRRHSRLLDMYVRFSHQLLVTFTRQLTTSICFFAIVVLQPDIPGNWTITSIDSASCRCMSITHVLFTARSYTRSAVLPRWIMELYTSCKYPSSGRSWLGPAGLYSLGTCGPL